MALKLLVVEDEEDIRTFYKALVEDTELKGMFEVAMADSVPAALKALQKQRPDIVLLDWNLAGKSGLEVLEAIRADRFLRSALVFVVTSLADKDREIEALGLGADDFLAKPFDPGVLQARLLNLARRREAPPSPPQEVLALGNLKLDLATGQLSIGNKPLPEPLHNKEAQLLRVFMKRPNVVHSSLHLWNAVWGYESDDFKHTLQVTLSHMRKKLGPAWGARLENLKDRGYMLTAP